MDVYNLLDPIGAVGRSDCPDSSASAEQDGDWNGELRGAEYDDRMPLVTHSRDQSETALMKAGISRFIRQRLRVAGDARTRYSQTMSPGLALLWWLLRVIPERRRARYACQRVAFRVASAFVVWLCRAAAIKFGWKCPARGRLAAYYSTMR